MFVIPLHHIILFHPEYYNRLHQSFEVFASTSTLSHRENKNGPKIYLLSGTSSERQERKPPNSDTNGGVESHTALQLHASQSET